MPIITLIPGLICIIVMMRQKTQGAFLNVFLPALLLIPVDFYLRIPGLPPLNIVEATLVPLGIGMIFTDLPRWRFSRVDLWVLFFVFTTGYTEYRAGSTSASMLTYFVSITTGLFPYMAGRLLIEQTGLRTKTVKRIVELVFFAAIFSMYEYVRKSNPYQWFWGHFYPGQWAGWITQIRWGFGRVAGPYSQSELAGMVFFSALILAIWLQYRRYPGQAPIRPRPLKNPRLVVFVLALILGMTQARGPWLGAIVALAVASIGCARIPKRRAFILLVLGIVVGIPAYFAAKEYSSGKRVDYGSEKETAQYRAQLLDNYLPIAEAGGAWGWGALGFPRVNGQISIDNEYLFSYLAHGYLGVIALILAISDSILKLTWMGFKTRSPRERHFVFSLLGVIAGIAFTITTVFLGSQTYELLFLFLGWAQSVRPLSRVAVLQQKLEAPVTLEETLGMRIYT
ncbi:O-antigen ligase family protein [Edaphobacter flagellatus]|uniref:O-antigen ligase family protein n=1 Tax=Edaphobacter flagellatus TaxID=1933044 RepID=UPI0021B18B05|nr:O-antigen ligase family protein [Edaphobacter flagellatus]